jgi:hypothetical protein
VEAAVRLFRPAKSSLNLSVLLTCTGELHVVKYSIVDDRR